MNLRLIFFIALMLISFRVFADENRNSKFSYHLDVAFEDLNFLVNRDQHSLNDQETLEATFELKFDNQKNLKIDLKPRLRIDFMDASRNRYIPNEAYALFYKNNFEVSAGLMLKSWGFSHFHNPTDVLNRRDLEDNVYDPDKLGEVMLDLSATQATLGVFQNAKLEAIVLPLFQETPLPENDTRFALAGNYLFIPYSKSDTQDIPSYAKSVGAALKASASFKSADFALSFYHGPEHNPGYYVYVNGSGSLSVQPFYYTIDQVGGNFQLALHHFILHAELAYTSTAENAFKTHAIPGSTQSVIPKSSFEYVPGIDFQLENIFGQGNLSATIEYYGESDHDNLLQDLRIYKNDIFFGVDYDFNNRHLTAVKMGVLKDLSCQEMVSVIDLQSHIYKDLLLGLRGVFVVRDSDPSRPLSFFDNNSFVLARLSYGFGGKVGK